MKNLKEDIQELQNILLNDDKLYYYKYGNRDLINSININDNKSKKLEENKNEKNIKKSYRDIYKPFFDSLAFRQNNYNKDSDNKNSPKKFQKYIIEYKNEKPAKNNNFNLEEEFGSSTNAFRKNQNSSKYNKNEYKYKSNSSNKNKNKLIEDFKKKYFRNRQEDQNLNNAKQKDLALQLNNMHISISNRIENDERFQAGGYKKVINNMLKEIDIIRKERNKENIIFENKIKILQNDILNDKKNNFKNKINRIYNIYSNDNNNVKCRNKNNNNKKRPKSNKNKTKNNSGKNNKKNININYIMNKTNYSLYKNKSMPKTITRLYMKNKNQKTKNKKVSPQKSNKQRIINEIKQLKKENELIEKKYNNLPISFDNFYEIVNMENNNNNTLKKINYKKNAKIINKNIDLIINNIINGLLYECIGDLMFIENQNSENSKKEKLKNVLKIASINLEKYPEKEKRMLINYNGIKNEIENNINNYKGNNEKKYPLIIKNKFEIDNDLIERCDLYQAKFLE